MSNHVLLWPASASWNLLITFDLNVLQHALGLQSVQVSSKHTIHSLEFCNFFIAKTSCAHANSKTERTQTSFLDILLRIIVFQATHAVLPTTNILIMYFSIASETVFPPCHESLRSSTSVRPFLEIFSQIRITGGLNVHLGNSLLV